MKQLISTLIFMTIQTALAFDGVITYEINDGGLPFKGRKNLTVGMSEEKVRFDMMNIEKEPHTKTLSVIVDIPNKTCTVIKDGTPQLIKFDEKYVDKNFLEPEESISKKNRKKILGHNVEEFESFYFHNKNRLNLDAWYTPSIEMRAYRHIWHLNSIDLEISLSNYFFHPVTGQIALELSYKKPDTSKKTYSASKVEKRKLDPEYFQY